MQGTQKGHPNNRSWTHDLSHMRLLLTTTTAPSSALWQQACHVWGSSTVMHLPRASTAFAHLRVHDSCAGFKGLSNGAHRQLESPQQSQIFEDLLQSSPSAATMAFNCSKTVPTRIRTENRRNFFFGEPDRPETTLRRLRCFCRCAQAPWLHLLRRP